MNQRIKQLAEQAQVLSDQFHEQWKAGPSNEEFFQQKFAELIVRECNRYACSAWEHGPLLGRDLLIHFGVEE